MSPQTSRTPRPRSRLVGFALAFAAATTVAGYGLAPASGHGLKAEQNCFGHPGTIFGTTGDDTGKKEIKGTKGPDVIVARSGNDQVDGRGGRDLICGNGGTDAIAGGNGDDKVSGGANGDLILGDKGNDRLFGDKGNDALGGGPGHKDLCAGGTGDDLATKSDCEHITGARAI